MHAAKRLKHSEFQAQAAAEGYCKLSRGWNCSMGLRKGDRVVPGQTLQRRGVRSHHLKRKRSKCALSGADGGSDSEFVVDDVAHPNTWSLPGLIRVAFGSIGKSIGTCSGGHETTVNMGSATGGMNQLAASVVTSALSLPSRADASTVQDIL